MRVWFIGRLELFLVDVKVEMYIIKVNGKSSGPGHRCETEYVTLIRRNLGLRYQIPVDLVTTSTKFNTFKAAHAPYLVIT